MSQNNYGVVNSSGYQSFNDTGNDSKITEYEYTNCSIPWPTLTYQLGLRLKDSLLNKVEVKAEFIMIIYHLVRLVLVIKQRLKIGLAWW